jgi:hypothetical protein
VCEECDDSIMFVCVFHEGLSLLSGGRSGERASGWIFAAIKELIARSHLRQFTRALAHNTFILTQKLLASLESLFFFSFFRSA